MPTMLIFGCGYSGMVLASSLINKGWRVIGTTRSSDNIDELQSLGIEPVVWPETDISIAIASATHLLVSIAPDSDGDIVLRAAGKEIETNAKHIEWAGYLSTTAVYGDRGGDWVNEGSPLNPSTKRGEWRVAAEKQWLETGEMTKLPIHIFRLAGIYGPGRGPFAKVRSGTARRIIKKDQVFSRIHVNDITKVILASIERPNAGSIYNLCDNQPAPPQDVIARAAEMLGLPIPEAIDFEQADLTPMARSFYAESKKVSNHKIHQELDVKLKFPDYESGLSALLKAETQ